jgi:phosphate starvation-inducible PhoH-like protein
MLSGTGAPVLSPGSSNHGPSLNEVTIPLGSHNEAILVLGPYDRYAKLLRQALDIDIIPRRGNLVLRGEDENVLEAKGRIEHLLGKSRKGRELHVRDIEKILLGGPAEGSNSSSSANSHAGQRAAEGVERRPRGLRARPVEPRTENQRRYLDQLAKNDLVFGVGPAGTGKTYLAVAAAVAGLRSGEYRRLVITRPVVEAGESLGFLPGDLAQKLDPYMRPIYDALHDQLEAEEVARLEETGVIEIAPLAYMRGRTLSNAFVILDEAQNTTVPQMKMFLTRLGEGSRMAVTGDPKQTDLASGQRNGLGDAVQRLRGLSGICVAEFSTKDIVRHRLVERIVRAYDGPSSRRGEERSGTEEEAGS